MLKITVARQNIWTGFTTANGQLKQLILGQYYDKTTGVVTDHLIKLLNWACGDIEKEIKAWEHWINIWSQFTLESFLESNIEVIKAKVPSIDHKNIDLETLGQLLPWTNDALRGYSVSTYTIQLDVSLVEYLRDQLGHCGQKICTPWLEGCTSYR